MKNLKKILAFALSAMVIFSVIGCSKAEEAGSDEMTTLEKIKESGQLVMGTSASYPPYEFHKQIDGKDEIVGFDIEIAKQIADDLGVELVIKDMKFEGLLAALNTGKIDLVVAGMTPTEERKKSVDFSKVYYVATQSVIVKNEDVENFKTAEDLKDKTVGVQKGTIQEEIAKETVPADQIKGLGKVADVILELKSGKVDGVIVESPVGKAYAKNNDDLDVAEIDFNTGDSGSAIAIKKGSPELVEAIDATLDKLMNEGKIDEFVAAATELADQ